MLEENERFQSRNSQPKTYNLWICALAASNYQTHYDEKQ